jgi:4a-hydroxytetrahydrobiopterin dehydratase
MTDRVFSRQFHGAKGAEAWRVLPEGAYAFFRTDSFVASARFVDAISGLVREGDEPHVDIRGDGVTVLLRAFKDDGFGLVQTDLDLAQAVSAIAREMGLTTDPAAIQSLSIIPGATDRRGIMPFWQRVLGYDRRSDSRDEDLVDPHGRLAPFWFEQMDELRADGAGTIHLVVWVPWDEAESRVAAGLAAGGRIVRHVPEELFWTLADPAGNEVDVATASAPDQAHSSSDSATAKLMPAHPADV